MTSVPAVFALLLTLSPAAFAGTSVLSTVGNAVLTSHAHIDEQLATFFSGACKKQPGTTKAGEAALETKYFPFAAHKLIQFNTCESNVLGKLAASPEGLRFSKAVVSDIAMKLPTLRKLNALATDLASKVDSRQRKSFEDDAQLARFGFLDAGQIERRKVRGHEITVLSKQLQATLKTEKALVATIWRGGDKIMADYLASIIKSKTPVSVFEKAALQTNPGRPLRYFTGAYSFRESVLLPMIEESNKLVQKLRAEYVQEPNGKRVFEPGFGVRNVLVDNMDLIVDVDDGPPAIKDLQCHLDYKYAKGDDDLGTTISVLTIASIPVIKGLSLALKATKLEKILTSSSLVQKISRGFEGGSGVYGFAMTAQAAIAACRGGVEHLDDGKTKCDANETAADLSAFESRELDKSNCGLMLVSSVLTETGMTQIGKRLSSIFSSNPALTGHIQLAQDKALKALKLKDQEQVVQSNAETAKDAKELVDPTKDPAGVDSKDDSKDDSTDDK